MNRRHKPQTAACLAALLSGCAGTPPLAPRTTSPPPPSAATRQSPVAVATPPSSTPAPTPPMGTDAHVSTTIIPGSDAYPATGTPTARVSAPRSGPINLNFPSVEVQDFSKAVLGGILGLPYSVDSAAHGTVTLVTARPVARADVLPLVEDALKASNLALEFKNGVYTVVMLDQAKTQAPTVGAGEQGFGNETLTLHYANPVEVKKLLDPIVPGVITTTDPVAGTMVLSGASGQRKAVRELVQQFDMDWLKGMSFALYVPKNTDARLIAPELEKLINAPGSTTAGLVRLVAMERLNGIVAIASRPQYLDDVRRWIEVLDREGQSSERRLYVYRVQNGRAVDLANVLVSAFGGSPSGSSQKPGSSQKHGFGDTVGSSSGFGSSSSSGFGSSSSGGDGLTSGSGTSTSGVSLGAGQSLPGQAPTPSSPNGKAGGSPDSLVITSDETNNAVVSYATPREYALIEDALRKLDIVPLQVVIEAAISEVTLNDEVKYGTQWFFQTHGNQYALSQGTTSSAIQNFPGFAYTAFASNGSIAATLNALSTVTHVEVLSAPNLLVLNNQTASLQVGDEVPISTGSAVGTVTANAPVVNSVDYRDTGVILKVTPRVNTSGLVLLDISQEVSQVDNTASTVSNNPIDSPVISERKIASSIAVQDGQTIALGGLISDQKSTMRTGVPILSAIPVLGALVGNRDNTRVRTELLVLLTPKVIRNPDEARAITDELKEKIRNIDPIRPKFEP